MRKEPTCSPQLNQSGQKVEQTSAAWSERMTRISRFNSDSFLRWVMICYEKLMLHDYRRQLHQCVDITGLVRHQLKGNVQGRKLRKSVWWSSVSVIHYSFMNHRLWLKCAVNNLKRYREYFALKLLNHRKNKYLHLSYSPFVMNHARHSFKFAFLSKYWRFFEKSKIIEKSRFS